MHDAEVGTSVAVVLHLVDKALEEGRLAGEAEIVETGVRGIVHDGDDLVSFVQAHRPSGPATYPCAHRPLRGPDRRT